jgi:alpha-amylase
MRRRPEAYHQTLREMEAAKERGEKKAGIFGTSIGDELLSKEEGLSAALVYDEYERRSGLVRLLNSGGNESGDFLGGQWEAVDVSDSRLVVRRDADGFRAQKSLTLGGSRHEPSLTIDLELSAEQAFEGTVELEMNVNLSGGGGNPDAYYRWGDEEARHDTADAAPANGLHFGNGRQGVDIHVSSEPPAQAQWSPIETVSNSEAGFEKVYQGSCLLLRWDVRLSATESLGFRVAFTVAQGSNLAVENAV